ncbi:MAG: hypothetical protein RLZ35_975 [Pseudomonadota bacterium]|jgi:iron-sulfur cluster assembly protein
MSNNTETLDNAITLTPSAQDHFIQVLSADATAKAIRIGIKLSGCSGQSYVLEPAMTRLPNEKLANHGPIPLWVDPAQLPALRGLEIDCIQDGLNKRIVFNNPNAKGTCGCGESFTS